MACIPVDSVKGGLGQEGWMRLLLGLGYVNFCFLGL